MKAVAHTGTDIASLTDIELPTPSPSGRDLLVKVEAVSVNPVDTKQRKTASATPAASATGSTPATRTVFLVANAGKPRS